MHCEISAPWSNIADNAASTGANSSLTLAEIQKAERERRAEQYRLELAQQQTQALLDQQQQKDAVLKWKLKPQNQAKSLAEIQAEESKARQTVQQITAVNVSSPLLNAWDFYVLNPFSPFRLFRTGGGPAKAAEREKGGKMVINVDLDVG